MTKLKNLQPSGPSLDTTYAYGASTGRLGRVTSAWNEHTDFVYDNQGRLIRKDLPNGLKEELSYDAQGRLSQVRVMNGTTELRKEQWTYNGYGEVATHVVNGVTTTYGYDNLGLLLSEVRPGYSASYVYDPKGNSHSCLSKEPWHLPYLKTSPKVENESPGVVLGADLWAVSIQGEGSRNSHQG